MPIPSKPCPGELRQGTQELLRLLITDVVMRGISGIEAAIEIEAMLPECKILLFSGQAATVDLLEHARAQGHEFEILNKPVHPRDLLQRVRHHAVAA